MRVRSLGLAALLAAAAAAAAPAPPGYAVATPHPLATQAGIEILEEGGNAFDAAVAVSAVLTVVASQSTGIGGGGFFLLQRGDGRQVFVDARETAPSAATAGMYLDRSGVVMPKASLEGARATAIPGLPAAWQHVARKYGSRPLARLLAPAIRHAREGFAIEEPKASMLARTTHFSPAAAAVWLPGGHAPAAGTVIRQPDLAATLERVARDGAAGFYQGELARRLVEGVRAGGGIWRLEDLQRYAVIERQPMQFFFRGYRLTLAPPPSAGGVTLAQALTLLEARGWPAADAAQAKHELVEAMRRAYRDRLLLGDPAFVAMPLLRLLSREYLLPLARGISADAATPSDALAPDNGREANNTAHFSILDASGNRVAATETVNTEFGSGFMPPGTGVLLNNEMDDFAASTTASNAYGLVGSAANAIAPGKRPLSSMAPTFVEGPRGLLIVGSKGGSRIISQVLGAVLGFVEGQGAREVVAAPRLHHQYLPDRIYFEPAALTAAEQERLRQMGHELREVPGGWGNMQAVWWDGDTLAAASDPRGVGTGAVRRTSAAAGQVGR